MSKISNGEARCSYCHKVIPVGEEYRNSGEAVTFNKCKECQRICPLCGKIRPDDLSCDCKEDK